MPRTVFCTRPEVTKEVILQRCKFYMDVQLWPLHGKITPDLWLSNFTEAELPYAVQLLSFFLFMSEDIIDNLLVAAFQKLSREIVKSAATYEEGVRKWEDFCAAALITWIPGETPNFSDSGIMFVRKARQILGIQERNIVSPEEAIALINAGSTQPVVFFDDFVGSGEQCITAWSRRYPTLRDASFQDLATLQPSQFYYCPLICTKYGYDRICGNCSNLNLNPTHVIGESYNVLSPASGFWPAAMRDDAPEVIKAASLRAGLPDTGGAVVNDWQGFHCLGLAIGFWNGVPDATLPIFYWEQNGWKPLMRRT